MEQCKSHKKNSEICTCTYEPCSRKGFCCECLGYHLKNKEVPACFFSKDAEKTYNRSINYFIKTSERG